LRHKFLHLVSALPVCRGVHMYAPYVSRKPCVYVYVGLCVICVCASCLLFLSLSIRATLKMSPSRIKVAVKDQSCCQVSLINLWLLSDILRNVPFPLVINKLLTNLWLLVPGLQPLLCMLACAVDLDTDYEFNHHVRMSVCFFVFACVLR